MLTMVNVQLAFSDSRVRNSPPETDSDRIRFFSGEFFEVAQLCKRRDHLYDRVIASEILYNCATYPSVLDTLALVLFFILAVDHHICFSV